MEGKSISLFPAIPNTTGWSIDYKSIDYKIIDNTPITLTHCEVPMTDILLALNNTNQKFNQIQHKTKEMNLDIFSVIDFRVLSGLIGETFSTELALVNNNLIKNPNIDGYPDLLQIATADMKSYFAKCLGKDLIKYKHGGLEVKNTFGTKKADSFLVQGQQRIFRINKKLDWKAHHQSTNNLIAIFSEYLNNRPIIAALFYSDTLQVTDWSKKQNPKQGSGMTSFSSITRTGFEKLKLGMKICLNDKKYTDFFGK